MLIKVILVALAVSVCMAQEDGEATPQTAVNFNCGTMVPVDKTVDDREPDGAIRIFHTPNYHTASKPVTVTISLTGGRNFNAFMVQVRRPEDDAPQGTWVKDDDLFRLFACDDRNRKLDTILPKSRDAGTAPAQFSSIDVTWKAPDQAGLNDVHFLVTLVAEDEESNTLQFWMANSTILSEVHEEF